MEDDPHASVEPRFSMRAEWIEFDVEQCDNLSPSPTPHVQPSPHMQHPMHCNLHCDPCPCFVCKGRSFLPLSSHSSDNIKQPKRGYGTVNTQEIVSAESYASIMMYITPLSLTLSLSLPTPAYLFLIRAASYWASIYGCHGCLAFCIYAVRIPQPSHSRLLACFLCVHAALRVLILTSVCSQRIYNSFLVVRDRRLPLSVVLGECIPVIHRLPVAVVVHS